MVGAAPWLCSIQHWPVTQGNSGPHRSKAHRRQAAGFPSALPEAAVPGVSPGGSASRPLIISVWMR